MCKINRDKLIYIVLLEIVLCGRLCPILIISDIGFIEYKACGMWSISNEGDVLFHYHCNFWIYK